MDRMRIDRMVFAGCAEFATSTRNAQDQNATVEGASAEAATQGDHHETSSLEDLQDITAASLLRSMSPTDDLLLYTHYVSVKDKFKYIGAATINKDMLLQKVQLEGGIPGMPPPSTSQWKRKQQQFKRASRLRRFASPPGFRATGMHNPLLQSVQTAEVVVDKAASLHAATAPSLSATRAAAVGNGALLDFNNSSPLDTSVAGSVDTASLSTAAAAPAATCQVNNLEQTWISGCADDATHANKCDHVCSPWESIVKLEIGDGSSLGIGWWSRQCSGSIISPDDVLTAGHCVMDMRTGVFNADWGHNIIPAVDDDASKINCPVEPYGRCVWAMRDSVDVLLLVVTTAKLLIFFTKRGQQGKCWRSKPTLTYACS
jgi:hypothetical protein